MPFHAGARVEHSADVVRTEVLNGSRKLAEARRFWIQLEVDEAALQLEEGPNRAMASNELEAAKPMQNFEVAVCHADRAARTHAALSETLIKVVVHFSFKHDVREDRVSHAPSQSRHVRAGLFDAEVIAVSAHLKMILRRSQRHKPTCPCQKCQAQE